MEDCQAVGLYWHLKFLQAQKPTPNPKIPRKHRALSLTRTLSRSSRELLPSSLWHVSGTHQQNLIRWTLVFWVEFFGWIFLLRTFALLRMTSFPARGPFGWDTSALNWRSLQAIHVQGKRKNICPATHCIRDGTRQSILGSLHKSHAREWHLSTAIRLCLY